MVLRIQGTIRAIDQGSAFISFDDQTIKVSLKDILPNAKVGDVYVLTIQPEAEAKLATDELARTILNQLTGNAKIDEKIDKA